MANTKRTIQEADDSLVGVFEMFTDSFTVGALGVVDFPVYKMAFGVEGAFTYVSATDPLPVTIISAATLTISGTVAATQSGTWTEANSAAMLTALQIMDDWDESDRAKVNPIVGQAGVQGGSGAVTALTQRTTLATDVALPSGDNTIGRVKITDGTDVAEVNEVPDGKKALEITTNRYFGGKTAVVATVTASGDTTVHTPASGKAIRLYWISAITDPDQATTPLIKVLIGTTEYYRVFAVAHWEVFEGAADQVLKINLSEASSVAVTAHIEEFDPGA